MYLIELESSTVAMLLTRELLLNFKNLLNSIITYIHIPDRITVTTDDEDDNSAGPSGVRQGNVAHSNLLPKVIQVCTLFMKDLKL